MFSIYKLRDHETIDFAAEELKKYLRMMMPDSGEVSIALARAAQDGFRLGFLEDFGLPCEAEDARLDDVIHVDTDEKGGILAGSNPRSVLFAVYRFLKENGCRWLYPGIDGEFIPLQEIRPTSYHKMADNRFRGFCNEGSESQRCMLEAADFYAKLEMNVFMLEDHIPIAYYNRYYNHIYNPARPAETVTHDQILQWKRQHEVEIARRGLMFHDIGHGWTCEPFGLPGSDGRNRLQGMEIPQETLDLMALLQGERQIYRGSPEQTNLCMSNPKARRIVTNSVADYAEKHGNVDYLHVWLADGQRNHCECEECRKMRPSDWYMVMMNEIDEELTRRGLDTRIVFIAYVDTLFAPEKITLKNPRRFSLLYAPIGRNYLSSITKDSVIPEEPPFLHNAWEKAGSTEACAAHLRAWKKSFQGPCVTYEYHFWRHRYQDVGGMEIARRIYEDIQSLPILGLDGIIEDGSQRSFFPNGFAVYLYAEALMDSSLSFDRIADDYFSHIYGKDYKEIVALLENMGEAFDFVYMEGKKSKNPDVSLYFNPKQLPKLAAVDELCQQLRGILKKNPNCPTRPRRVSLQLLELYALYCRELKKPVEAKALGHNFKAEAAFREFCRILGEQELPLERYYDHGLVGYTFNMMFKNPKKIMFEDQLVNE